MAGTANSPASSARPSSGSARSGLLASTGSGRPFARHRQGVAMGAQRVGWVVDRGRELYERPELPARAATLDELLLVIRRDSPLRFDPSLGFHMYGADICLQAAETRPGRGGRERTLPPQFAQPGVAQGVLRQRRDVRPQMGAPPAGGNVVRRSSTATERCACWGIRRFGEARQQTMQRREVEKIR